MLFNINKCGTVRYFISHADHQKYNLLRNIFCNKIFIGYLNIIYIK
jgi:hypothetical protein